MFPSKSNRLVQFALRPLHLRPGFNIQHTLLVVGMVVGWAMAARMTSRLLVDALGMAVRRRLPDAELLAHSDRGSQYASDHYQ